jgi:predicted amidophosphoribosyltransferase
VVQALKFRRLDRLGPLLAGPLAAEIANELAAALPVPPLPPGHQAPAGRFPPLAPCHLVVPVPLHWRRRLARGYNQAERIARPLARRLGLPCVGALRRRRPTPPQTALARRQRRRSVADAFAPVARHRGALAGRRVLLVDDVVTTGATLEAAARCLRRAGAAVVVAVAVARTPPESSQPPAKQSHCPGN